MRAAFDHLPRETLARDVSLRRATRPVRLLYEVVRGPLPDVDRHVLIAEAVRRKPPDRRGALVPVGAQVLPRELALPGVRHHPALGGKLVAPGVRGAGEA